MSGGFLRASNVSASVLKGTKCLCHPVVSSPTTDLFKLVLRAHDYQDRVANALSHLSAVECGWLRAR